MVETNRLRSWPQTLCFTAALSPPSSPLVFSPIHSSPAAFRDKWPPMICVFVTAKHIFFPTRFSSLYFLFFLVVFVCSLLHLQPPPLHSSHTLLLAISLWMFFLSPSAYLLSLPCIGRGGSCASSTNGVWYIRRCRAFIVVACLSYQSAWRRDKVASIRGPISHRKRKERALRSCRVEKHSSAVGNSDVSSRKDNVSVFALLRLFPRSSHG